MLRLGIDLGGTKTEIIAIDENGTELLRKRVQTRRDDYQATLQTIQKLIDETEDALGTRGTIGIRMKQKMDREQGLFVAACSADHRDISLNF